MLRRILLCLLAVVFFSPVCAHADQISFTPNSGGVSYSFSVGATADATQSGSNGADLAVFYANNNTIAFYVLNEISSQQYVNGGYGHVDAILVDSANNISYYLVGSTLFTGDVTNLQFISGIYNLTASPAAGAQDGNGGVLSIGAATAPEPSSLALLSTGFLGLAGVARRRFRTA